MTFRPSPVRESSAPITTPVASDSKGHSGEGGRPGPGLQSESTKAAEASSAGLQGDAYYERGLYTKAVNEYQKGLDVDPQNVELRNKVERARRAQTKLEGDVTSAGSQGDAFYEEGAYEKAIREYQRGLSLDPSNGVLQKKINRARRAQAAEQKYGQRPPTKN
jgi:tetratricopeptide (TPR) repeat protein